MEVLGKTVQSPTYTSREGEKSKNKEGNRGRVESQLAAEGVTGRS